MTKAEVFGPVLSLRFAILYVARHITALDRVPFINSVILFFRIQFRKSEYTLMSSTRDGICFEFHSEREEFH